MATPQSATVYITNNTGGNAYIQLAHRYASSAVESQAEAPIEAGSWKAAPGQTVGPLTVNYEIGAGTLFDWWWCSAYVLDGPTPGIYRNKGTLVSTAKECMLTASDNGTTITNSVSTSEFYIGSASSCSGGMKYVGPYEGVTNVFVLMLENHSFDHLLGFSGLNGPAPDGSMTSVNGLNGEESNDASVNGSNDVYMVVENVVDPMPTDPGHEFMDTMIQLCGQGTATPFPAGPYPPINNSGFVANFLTDTEGAARAEVQNAGAVMSMCDPTLQAPVLWQLASEFAVCDNWFSSMPGPTWPNRLFAMGASSGGLSDSPTKKNLATWKGKGFSYPNGSIFQHLSKKKLKYALYNDKEDSFVPPGTEGPTTVPGQFSIVSFLKGISSGSVLDFSIFQTDVMGPYPYQFTFIEPNYGKAAGNFVGGSSQHPMDSLAAGEALIAATYNAVRNSPHWPSSILIITYDEHGGFYDHVAPETAPSPGDAINQDLNTNNFNFEQYGVRVPAVVISPFIPKGTIDHTLYDHTSMLRTLEDIWKMLPLTDRDKHANGLYHLLSLTEMRTDCPSVITPPATSSSVTSLTGGPVDESLLAVVPADSADPTDSEPLPEQGNVWGFLAVAQKTDFELSDQSPATEAAIVAEVQAIETKGQANAYFQKVLAKLQAFHAANPPNMGDPDATQDTA